MSFSSSYGPDESSNFHALANSFSLFWPRNFI